MRAPVSIVIPTLDAAEQLPATLGCLIEGLSAGLVRELVISDGGSRDATQAIADAAGAVVVTGPSGRGGQLARGAAAATGEWLLFLHADTHLSAGWAQVVDEHLQIPDAAGWFPLRFRAGGVMPRLVAGWANMRSSFGLPYGDQGLLIHRALYAEVGGYPAIALMEDVALARLLHGRMKRLASPVSTSAERYLRDGWIRQGAGNLWNLACYFSGVPTETLARRYERRGGS